MPVSEAVSWTVLGDDGEPIEPVESYLSYLAAIGYDSSAAQLFVQFRTVAVYRYFRVPYGVYLDFMAAPSKGRFLDWCVRPRFSFQRVL
jgi:hypothetical protein